MPCPPRSIHPAQVIRKASEETDSTLDVVENTQCGVEKKRISSHACHINQPFASFCNHDIFPNMAWLNIPPSEWYARAGHCPLALTSRTTTIQPATPTWYPAQSPISCASQANSLASSSPLCRFWRTPRCYVNSQKLQGKKSFIWTWRLAERIWILKKKLRIQTWYVAFRCGSPTVNFWYSICWNNVSTFFNNLWIFFLVGYHGLKHREGLGVKVVCLANVKGVKGHRSNGEHRRDPGGSSMFFP